MTYACGLSLAVQRNFKIFNRMCRYLSYQHTSVSPVSTVSMHTGLRISNNDPASFLIKLYDTLPIYTTTPSSRVATCEVRTWDIYTRVRTFDKYMLQSMTTFVGHLFTIRAVKSSRSHPTNHRETTTCRRSCNTLQIIPSPPKALIMKLCFAFSILLLTASALDENITQSDPAIGNVTDVVDVPTTDGVMPSDIVNVTDVVDVPTTDEVMPMVVNEGPGWMIMEDPPADANATEPQAMPPAPMGITNDTVVEDPMVISESPGWIIMEDVTSLANATEPQAMPPVPKLYLPANTSDSWVDGGPPLTVNATDPLAIDDPAPVMEYDGGPMVISEGPDWMIMENATEPANGTEPQAIDDTTVVKYDGIMMNTISEGPGLTITESPPAPANATEPQVILDPPVPMVIKPYLRGGNGTGPMVVTEGPGWMITESPPAPANATEPQAIDDAPAVKYDGIMMNSRSEGPGLTITESPPVPANTTEAVPFIPVNPCMVVRCASSTPKCIVTPQGTAKCVADDYIPTPKTGKAEKPEKPEKPEKKAVWWDHVSKNFKGENLYKCAKRGDMPPADGTSCSKKSKICFFGNMTCTTTGLYPSTRCECSDGSWKCAACNCPTSATDEIH
jgi:hypothetical protein